MCGTASVKCFKCLWEANISGATLRGEIQAGDKLLPLRTKSSKSHPWGNSERKAPWGAVMTQHPAPHFKYGWVAPGWECLWGQSGKYAHLKASLLQRGTWLGIWCFCLPCIYFPPFKVKVALACLCRLTPPPFLAPHDLVAAGGFAHSEGRAWQRTDDRCLVVQMEGTGADR